MSSFEATAKATPRGRWAILDMRTLVVLALVIAIAALPNTAFAYRTLADADGLPAGSRVLWESPLRFQIAGAPPSSLSGTDVDAIVSAAFAQWAGVGCGTPEFINQGQGPDGASSGDGIVSIVFIRSGWSDMGLDPNQAAITDILYSSAGTEGVYRILDADILLNAEDFRWAGEDGSSLRALRPVLVHEIGHALGLAHPCEATGGSPSCDDVPGARETTMFPLYAPDQQRSVQADDREGVCELYGPLGPPCPAPCGPGTFCRDGACLPEDCLDAECASCLSDAECAGGFCAADGYCRERRMGGADCMRGPQCLSGVCAADGTCAASCGGLQCSGGTYCAVDGACESPPPDFGAACDGPAECSSSLCVRSTLNGTFCSVPCSGGCPANFRCASVEGESVCAPVPPGCSVRSGGSSSSRAAPWVLTLLLAAAHFLVRIRRNT